MESPDKAWEMIEPSVYKCTFWFCKAKCQLQDLLAFRDSRSTLWPYAMRTPSLPAVAGVAQLHAGGKEQLIANLNQAGVLAGLKPSMHQISSKMYEERFLVPPPPHGRELHGTRGLLLHAMRISPKRVLYR
eukprot:3057687-Amphidinium_carterae.1